MIKVILDTLKNDAALQALLQGTAADKKIYAFTANTLNSIAYSFTNLISNKVIGQARLELTINTLLTDYGLNMDIADRVKQLLLTLADQQFNDEILEIEQNGGGSLRNEETKTVHNKLILTIKYKERK